MSQMSGTVLRALRKRTGLSVSEVAGLAKVSASYLVRVEDGEVSPSDAWLGFVASVLSDALIADPPAPPAPDPSSPHSIPPNEEEK